MPDTDLLIVGAGPAGLFACFYAGLRGLRVTLLDSLSHLGGQVAALYPDKNIFDIAGFPAVTGRELVDGLTEQARLADPRIVLGEQAAELEKDADAVTVTTSSGRRIRAGAVLITAGIGSFTPKPLPALDGCHARGVHYVVAAPPEYAGRHVVIVGGGDSAVDWANTLVNHARSVTLVHRGRRLRAHPRSQDALRASSAEVLVTCEVTAVHGAEDLEGVTLNSTTYRQADVLIPALGHTASLGPLESWGIGVHDRRIEVGTDMATCVDRVYAAGDVTVYPGKVRLIAVGFGEAATAVNNIAVRLRPDEELFPGHSTEREASWPT
ncbi:ferredoxin--NADP(+) reductase [Actinoplanes sp. ATCC 53533]|uniref:NAD(P)/FAD-dependent oxidoreductase n=1 Tax=Actinoplanes sp. ATCC 53533 TaxID=1288362 RepID=UPI000F76EDDC|nr:NAD(P)/FAD-dependent oxidoreductase [Actinoplanes sp. ATCC 53533]RSM64771.1 ferredoxin--NADP(+) reductase [Actinoplanes sp. ATCC 53533]